MRRTILKRAALALFLGLASAAIPAGADAPGDSQSAESRYRLGPGDQVLIHALEADEINGRTVRIDPDGSVKLPLIGELPAAGLTVRELEKGLAGALGRYVLDPQVTVTVAEYRSQRVTVLGSVSNPGVHRLEGPVTLLEVISQVGGLRDDASFKATVTRSLKNGRIPLASAWDDRSNGYSVAEVNIKALADGRNPESNIVILGDDVVSVPKADLIYVLGDVEQPGGFVLQQHETVSVIQAVAFASGLSRTAAPKNARILRVGADGTRTEIDVNLKALLRGKEPDFEMQSDDILLVPGSATKAALQRTVNAAIALGTGVVIFRR